MKLLFERILCFLAATLVLSAYQDVPPRKDMLVIVVKLMAEDCQWQYGRQDEISGLECVKDKIDLRLEQLHEDDK